MVARYKELMEDDLAPYWVYKSALLENTRASHAAMHNHVYHRDSPFWDTWYPPNAWNCQCYVEALSERQAKSGGFKLNKPFQPNGDQDWSYKVGATDQIAGVVDSAYSKTIKALRGVQLGEWGKTWQRDHVKQVLEAAREAVEPDEYKKWAGTILSDYEKMKEAYAKAKAEGKKGIDFRYTDVGDSRVIGALDIRTFDFLVNTKNIIPESAVIVATRDRLQHAQRGLKKTELKKAISEEQIMRVPEILRNPNAILWDKTEGGALYVFDIEGDSANKLVVTVDYALKGVGKRNVFNTAGKIPTKNLNSGTHDLISGYFEGWK
jgi:hypothetical protein